MTSFEIAILATVLRGILIILALLLAEKMLRGVLTAGCRRILWCLCAIWLVIPQPSSRSLPWQIDYNRMRKAAVHHAPGTVKTLRSLVAPTVPAGAVLKENKGMGNIRWRKLEGWALLLLGAPACLLLAVKYLRCRRRIRGLPPVSDRRIVDAWRRITGGRRGPELFDAGTIGLNPTIFGCFRQKLLLPEARLRDISDRELELLLYHEYCHYRAGDGRLNMLMLAIGTFFWYNPLFLLARRKLRRSCELHCDEQVLRRFSGEVNTYGKLLLKFAGAPATPAVAMGLSEAPRELSRRIRKMVGGLPSPNQVRAGRLASLLLIVLLSCPVFLVAVNQRTASRLVGGKLPVMPHVALSYEFSPRTGVMRWQVQSGGDFPVGECELILRYGDRKIICDPRRAKHIDLALKQDKLNHQLVGELRLSGESIANSYVPALAENHRFAGDIELKPGNRVPLFETVMLEKLASHDLVWNELNFQLCNQPWSYESANTVTVELRIPGFRRKDYRDQTILNMAQELGGTSVVTSLVDTLTNE